MTEQYKTLHLRIKDKHYNYFLAQAKEVNMVWNYCNEMSIRILEKERRFCTKKDLQDLTSGSTKGEDGLTIHSQTISTIIQQYINSQSQFKKTKLKWRVSSGKRRSLIWIPFQKKAIKLIDGNLFYLGNKIDLFYKIKLKSKNKNFKLENLEVMSGSFSEDSLGRLYFNMRIKVVPTISLSKNSIGIDLGCKEAITCSNGEQVEGRNYRKKEEKLAKAQRANKKRLIKKIHRKIANKRKDDLHKFSNKLVKENNLIIVGNVSSKKLVKTFMAKSVLDAGWGIFKTMLEYKSRWAGIRFKEVSEINTTVTCSICGSISGPKGLNGLREREWTCIDCGSYHNRDVNAARNILRIGRDTLVEGTPCL